MVETSITIRNDISELRQLAKWAGLFCDANGLQAHEHRLTLVLEELLTNVIAYGYDDGAAHEINAQVKLEGGTLTAVFEDDGRPFNPHAAEKPVLTDPLETRTLGDLGIHLILTIMDSVDYARVADRNRTTMTMDIG